MRSTKCPQNAKISDCQAAQAGIQDLRGATNSHDCKTTTTSLPHHIGVSPPAGKEGEPVQGNFLPLVVRGSSSCLCFLGWLTFDPWPCRGFPNLLTFLRVAVGSVMLLRVA
ncbi:MAG: hypothetical protein LBF94_02765 [Puniceicoccales bacterium]|nr:hypothetical protein [Puniceicoccales bacterium]